MMNFKMGQHLQTGQQLILAPRIIQTMEIMQLPLPALEAKIEQELQSNIALELAETDPLENDESETDVVDEIAVEEYDQQSDADLSDLPPRKKEFQDRDPKLDAMASIRARQESLSEVLLHQWSFAEVDSEVTEIGRILIGLIDADGFITHLESEIISTIRSELNKSVKPVDLDSYFHALQEWLDPPGIAARSLQESLMIQVNAFKEDDVEGWNDVAVVIDSHLDDLIANRLPKVASSTGFGIDRVKRAIEKMHELTLSPGRFISTDTVLPVIPDAFIQFDDVKNQYVVGISSGRVPPLRISTEYEALSSDKNTTEDTKQFIQRNINAARWIIEAITQRKKTIQHIVQIVSDRQVDFLEKGDAYLRPLPMVEVADMLGIHVATVSRAVADKWVQTPRGIFPLRRFFSGGTGSSFDGNMSWEAVKTRLQEVVDAENKTKPLSDESIVKKLQEQGIEIARRTVVKYRQQLGLPAARLRKEY